MTEVGQTTDPRGERAPSQGRLVVISGPSGAGKTTLARRLAADPTARVRISISATTRDPRPGEQDGVDYYFLSRPEFEAARDRGEFLEFAEVHGQFYGTPIAPVRELTNQGYCVLLVIDVQGGLQVRERMPDALLVWIDAAGPESLERRLRLRQTDDDATIRRRLEKARWEQSIAERDYPRDCHVRNEDGREEDAAEALRAILRRHGCGG